MTLGSLFDGIGGWQLAAIHNGVTPIWSSEIEAFPCAVTKKHFPDTLQLGDITKLNGADLPPVDIICAGSPCQDLSVAGKQEGLKGARSGLFMDAIKLVRDMRRASGGKSPRYFVWENVPGAFSSNKGMDFRAVLEEITEAEIPMPDGGKWAEAGVVEWDGGSLAWRVLDAQYWGVPQRRRRIFLVADFGGGSAGEILFERESVRGDSSESGEAGEGLAAGVESGVGSASIVRMRAGCAGGGKGALVSREKSLSLLNHNEQVLFTGNCLTPWDCQAKRIYKQDGVFPCLQSTESNGEKPGSVYVPDKARSLTARNDGSPCVDRGPDIIAAGFKAGAGADAGGLGYQVEQMPTLTSAESGTQRPTVAVYDMTHADEVMRKVPEDRHAVAVGFLPQHKAESMTPMIEKSPCLVNGTNPGWQNAVYAMQRSDKFQESQVAHTLAARDYKSFTDLIVGSDENATEGNKVLRVLREAYGEEKVCEWCTAILARIQSAEILRQRVHEESISGETAQGNELDDDSLPCAEFVAEWLLRDLREREKCGRTPQRRESSQQQHRELDEGMPELSYKTPSSAKDMCDLWRQAQGAWLLLQALAAFQEIRKPVNVKSWGPIKTVRRLTPLEAERLQGLPDYFTLIDDKTCSDTARYKALGNGMAQPCADYVIRRIKEAAT